MDTLLALKTLSNETRYLILEWLKDPRGNFHNQIHLPEDSGFAGGVCVGSISVKSGLAQSVVSGYLVKMQQAGLLESKRFGQHTYYRRNEANIRLFKEKIQNL